MQNRQDSKVIDPIFAAGWYIDIAYHLIGELALPHEPESGSGPQAQRLREVHRQICDLLNQANPDDQRLAPLRQELLQLEATLRVHGVLP